MDEAMRPVRKAVLKWWRRIRKISCECSYRPVTKHKAALTWKSIFSMTSGNPSQTNSHSDSVCWSVWDAKQIHQTYSNSIKLQICGQHYLCPWSNYHKAKEWTNSMHEEEDQKQSFSSRLPESLKGTNSHSTERSYTFVDLHWKHRNHSTQWHYEMWIRALASQIYSQ